MAELNNNENIHKATLLKEGKIVSGRNAVNT